MNSSASNNLDVHNAGESYRLAFGMSGSVINAGGSNYNVLGKALETTSGTIKTENVERYFTHSAKFNMEKSKEKMTQAKKKPCLKSCILTTRFPSEETSEPLPLTVHDVYKTKTIPTQSPQNSVIPPDVMVTSGKAWVSFLPSPTDSVDPQMPEPNSIHKQWPIGQLDKLDCAESSKQFYVDDVIDPGRKNIGHSANGIFKNSPVVGNSLGKNDMAEFNDGSTKATRDKANDKTITSMRTARKTMVQESKKSMIRICGSLVKNDEIIPSIITRSAQISSNFKNAFREIKPTCCSSDEDEPVPRKLYRTTQKHKGSGCYTTNSTSDEQSDNDELTTRGTVATSPSTSTNTISMNLNHATTTQNFASDNVFATQNTTSRDLFNHNFVLGSLPMNPNYAMALNFAIGNLFGNILPQNTISGDLFASGGLIPPKIAPFGTRPRTFPLGSLFRFRVTPSSIETVQLGKRRKGPLFYEETQFKARKKTKISHD
ncbi:14281_t:CDS:2 [Ambispora leptoticha]|uniref:14281_t:CDS:1 n=1 Tax=Ambispora leptoticha TaxID=144679 RepID=A0A9N9FKH9_9GLOM|nr:14281_t:CDS:2 [Ambispora leptoticha]